MKCGVVILAGGQSHRMGKNKAELKMDGRTFLDTLVNELECFDELMVSVDEIVKHLEIKYPMVEDLYHDCGPMSGVYSALKKSTSDALIVVPCDVPLFSRSLAMDMIACLDVETDAVIAVTEDGREHPLCGVYTKNCLNQLGEYLKIGDYRMRDVLSKLRIKTYIAGKESWRIQNVNTPEEYEKLTRNCYTMQ